MHSSVLWIIILEFTPFCLAELMWINTDKESLANEGQACPFLADSVHPFLFFFIWTKLSKEEFWVGCVRRFNFRTKKQNVSTRAAVTVYNCSWTHSFADKQLLLYARPYRLGSASFHGACWRATRALKTPPREIRWSAHLQETFINNGWPQRIFKVG